MSRPSYVFIDTKALYHNLLVVKQHVKNKKVIAMVKCNAYGCGVDAVVNTLAPYVDGFGVACIEEAIKVQNICNTANCILFQGIFSEKEFKIAYARNLQIAIHQERELAWLLNNPSANKISIWIKVNTGMHRLGFQLDEIPGVMTKLNACPWVKDIKIMTHLACADNDLDNRNQSQVDKFNSLVGSYHKIDTSIANSAAILSNPDAQGDIVRAGIMLYGVSPFNEKTGKDLGLLPVMHFKSRLTTIYHYPANIDIGYGATWHSDEPCIIGIVPVGYGDGYPRNVINSYVWIREQRVPVVGRVSMDMLTVDLTNCKNASLDDEVELWGGNIPVEEVSHTADTIAYELLTRISSRVCRK
ncbi:MAG: alanine racemase [Legionellales bacterium RIFCSPHIGHO2_12_FULL_35_11]|nr:MAG: alanine racemase [Legionellales bacterium RIFCSPHIGHO2_12_FULL_35_11]